jgi:hypothetical protein
MCHLSLPAMRGSGNGKWKMENGKWKMKTPQNLRLIAYSYERAFTAS